MKTFFIICSVFCGLICCSKKSEREDIPAMKSIFVVDYDSRISKIDVAVPVNLEKIKEHEQKVAAGGNHVCAINSVGRIYCWGMNNHGQLGNGTRQGSNAPVIIDTLSDAIDIAAGSGHTCAVTRGGKVYCWGEYRGGQLGTNIAGDHLAPREVKGVTSIGRIFSHTVHTCALSTQGQLFCWGGHFADSKREPYPGSPAIAVTPQLMLSGQSVINLSIGSHQACALATNEKMYCWRIDSHYPLQLNAHLKESFSFHPGETIEDHFVAGSKLCMRKNGNNWNCLESEIRQNVSIESFSVLNNAILSGAIDVAVGATHICYLNSPGRVFCYGNYLSSTSDTSDQSDRRISALKRMEISEIKHTDWISAGYNYSCGLDDKDIIACWGVIPLNKISFKRFLIAPQKGAGEGASG